MPEPRPGVRYGPWTVKEPLGAGGNATVWRAKATDAPDVAIKVLNTIRADREPYRRFVREIGVLKELRGRPGVLPVLEAYLPDDPAARDRPWIAMPIAHPIANALEGTPLTSVVSAIAIVAETLAGLAADCSIAHRDIKPANLYELEGQWLIGDFGLVHLPDLDEMTQTGRPMGPLHFMPYEMIRDPRNADPHPGDVYSLAKSLWVLATEERFPPEGHQSADVTGFRIADMRPNPHAEALDRLIDSMTRIHPNQRPTKEQVARDLRAWLDLASEPVSIAIGDLQSRIRSKIDRELRQQSQLADNRALAGAAWRRFQAAAKPVNDSLRLVHPNARLDEACDQQSEAILRTPNTMAAQRSYTATTHAARSPLVSHIEGLS